MKTIKNSNIAVTEAQKFNKFPKLQCRKLRTEVRHGVKDENGIQNMKCLSCGDTYTFHIDGREKIEMSHWKICEKIWDTIEITPYERKRKKRLGKIWKKILLIFRRRKKT